MSEAATACPDCARAAAGQWFTFSLACRGCAARLFSRGPDFDRVRRLHPDDARYLELRQQYRELLAVLELTHDEVRAAADADRLGKGVR